MSDANKKNSSIDTLKELFGIVIKWCPANLGALRLIHLFNYVRGFIKKEVLAA